MSYRNDTNAGYDRTLLSSVPDPTRAEKQEGYNLDLLDEGRDRRAPTPPDGPLLSDQQHGATDGYSPGAVGLAKEGQLENGGRRDVDAKVPWYRTRWGVTAIVIAIIVIIGAAVGGAVGGTHHSSSKKNNANSGSGSNNGTNTATTAGNIPQQSAPSTSTSTAVQAEGPAQGTQSTPISGSTVSGSSSTRSSEPAASNTSGPSISQNGPGVLR